MKKKLMGILNVTPDSFYDQGLFFDSEKAIERGFSIFKEGADILDIGGESTRPGAEPVSEEEELRRVIPVIRGVKERCPVKISIDTMKPRVAELALEAGAEIINDVNGLSLPMMKEVAKKSHAEVIVMHMKGVPKTMQINPSYEKGIMAELISWFSSKINELASFGIDRKKIIVDPGIGFGKSVADNLEILHNLPKLKNLGYPLVVGLSRKSFLSKLLNRPGIDLLPPTIASNTYALLKGADIIRVHDVKEHRSVIDLLDVGFELS